MNRYPLWINVLVLVVILGGALFALPNIFGDDPALQITREDGNPMTEIVVSQVIAAMEAEEIGFSSAILDNEAIVVRFGDVASQLQGSVFLGEQLPFHIVALTLAPRTPAWLRLLGLEPMSLGLDLRGGVHFLFQVDLDTALNQLLQTYQGDLRSRLREAGIRNGGISLDGGVISFGVLDSERMDEAEEIIRILDPLLTVNRATVDGQPGFRVQLSPTQVTERQKLRHSAEHDYAPEPRQRIGRRRTRWCNARG